MTDAGDDYADKVERRLQGCFDMAQKGQQLKAAFFISQLEYRPSVAKVDEKTGEDGDNE